jgi:hypothetical protein
VSLGRFCLVVRFYTAVKFRVSFLFVHAGVRVVSKGKGWVGSRSVQGARMEEMLSGKVSATRCMPPGILVFAFLDGDEGVLCLGLRDLGSSNGAEKVEMLWCGLNMGAGRAVLGDF